MKKSCTGERLSNLLSAEKIGKNEDLVREIFIHLPVRCLIKFKLVSKHWFSLISDPQFGCYWTKRLNPSYLVPSGLFFYNSLTKSEEIETVSFDGSLFRVPSLSFLKIAFRGDRMTILSSCNGLLLCRFTSPQYINQYCVCNPTTKNYKILPQLILIKNHAAMGFVIAFDPSKSSRYKVVCQNHNVVNIQDQDIRVEIYSSETGKWNSSNCSDSNSDYSFLGRRGFYWNSSIHWIDSGCVKYFSLEYEFENKNLELFILPPKPQINSSRQLRYLGECRGHLHLVYVQNRWIKRFQVWERDVDTLKWSVKYHVDIRHLLSRFPEINVKRFEIEGDEEYAFSILSVYKGEKEGDSALVLTIPGKVISYNLHYKTAKILSELPSRDVIEKSGYYYSIAFNFIETLASV